ncbi:4a-hydroxytetrahydrobiopterin dehydratase [Streptomyces decoyicus]|uniref:4a-hydroxytetrahydrobiopterin dehydratase n=1 Tax=Streptomyces decoyicus TaxID=249567 RepID=UPI0004AA7A54|nr:4a-hydroxytetrahydrobiopterin dehydratase [Streptomyces decoyicus]KOG48770.1 pterin-4-alpha-carbinolamine dehydratase [Streptomyces decoyicus]QZY18776.1 4a-hydroxytetrahydrobiopterin dehydratase [Streptomyces decoyicus]
MALEPLTDQRIASALTELPGWTVKGGALTASYKGKRDRLPSFYAAVAPAEDAANHHAHITILYNTMTFALTTHDADDRITERDVSMARTISGLAQEHGLST